MDACDRTSESNEHCQPGPVLWPPMATERVTTGSSEEEEVGAAGSGEGRLLATVGQGYDKGGCRGKKMRRVRLEATTTAREDGCSLRLWLHDGEEEWVTVTRLRARRQQRQGKRRRRRGSCEEAREEGEGSGSPARAAAAGEGGGCGISMRSAQRWLRLRAREAAALAGGRSWGERRGLCAGGAATEEGVAAVVVEEGRAAAMCDCCGRRGGEEAEEAMAGGSGRDNSHNRGWQVVVTLLCGSGLQPQISDGVEEEEVAAARMVGARAGSNGDATSRGGNWRGAAIVAGDGCGGGGDAGEI
ncbi:hypothetical protein BHE74_00042099, partial [Ensete ventricosum]